MMLFCQKSKAAAARCVSMSHNFKVGLKCISRSSTMAKNSFLNGSSAAYIEELYNDWLKDPKSVPDSWGDIFSVSQNFVPDSTPDSTPGEKTSYKTIQEHYNVQRLIRTYQVSGHYAADLDPLQIDLSVGTAMNQDGHQNYYQIKKYLSLVNNMSETEYYLPPNTFIGKENEKLPLREIVKRLDDAYCRTIGVEYMFIHSKEKCDFIRKRLEVPGAKEIGEVQKLRLLKRLTRATSFEAFLAKKWSSEKRFGLEGLEVLVPAVKQVIDKSTELGVESFVMGMPHRGRLNILANVCRKPLEQLFTRFSGLETSDEGSGDVKYHLGTSTERLNRANNKNIKISLVANPSHLEAVDPVVLGKTKSEQFYMGDIEGKRVMGILIHGDAAFSGQGVVYETIHLTELPEYTTHGTIHIVGNNQIGFTTDPRFSRSSKYCTCVAKVVEAPIFHVNADDPESVMHVCNIAAEYRSKFQDDVIIDIVGYRRNGHNEIDEPMFTQPTMYKIIKKLPNCLTKYANKLIDSGLITKDNVQEIRQLYETILETSFEEAKKQTSVKNKHWIDSPWKGFFKQQDDYKTSTTGVAEETLKHISTVFSTPPPNFTLHQGIVRILKQRNEMVMNRTIDWALGEALAFGTLLKEGIHVRLSGQDVERGTFSHRHHVLHDQTVDSATYKPLHNLYPDQAVYSVCNSSLSEYGVLGFELGYSITNPNALVIWEAQFGDFNNSAQCIIDQFLSSGETKWVRQSGLVMLQPHGMEGMGPEHSSARLERFLQLSDDDADTMFPLSNDFEVRQLSSANWTVAVCTTPANMFHILRRQIALPFRKPLILMSPKSLLRHPDARSSFDEIKEGTSFQRVIKDSGPGAANPSNVQKLIFCSGRVYYDLVDERKEKGLEKEIVITRVEQISPFPYDLLLEECQKYPKAKLVWTQEEHKNQGAWTYVQPRLTTMLQGARPVLYSGRSSSSAAATGAKTQHLKELKSFLSDSISI